MLIVVRGRAASWNLAARQSQTLRAHLRKDTLGSARQFITRFEGAIVSGNGDGYRPGQLKRGFNRIARDVDRAIGLALFDPLQAFLLQRARELCWTASTLDGSGEPVSFRLNVSELARVAECNRPWLSKQLRELVQCRVLLEFEDGSLLINKDFREWLKLVGGRPVPRFTERQIEECLAVAKSSKGVRRTRHPLSGAPDTPEHSTRHPLSGAPDTPEHSTRQSGPTPPETPSRTRASEEFQKSIKSSGRVVKSAAAQTDHAESGEPGKPPYPDEDGPLMVMGGNHPVGIHEGRALWDLLWKAFKSERVCNGWFEHQAWYPLDCWEAAIREAVRRGKTRLETIRYVEAIAADYAANGIPAARTAPEVATPRLSPSEQRRQAIREGLRKRFGNPVEGEDPGKEAMDGQG